MITTRSVARANRAQSANTHTFCPARSTMEYSQKDGILVATIMICLECQGYFDRKEREDRKKREGWRKEGRRVGGRVREGTRLGLHRCLRSTYICTPTRARVRHTASHVIETCCTMDLAYTLLGARPRTQTKKRVLKHVSQHADV
jgi:hypothetical protein